MDVSKWMARYRTLFHRYLTMYRLLVRIEFANNGQCPFCESAQQNGHTSACELGTILAEIRQRPINE